MILIIFFFILLIEPVLCQDSIYTLPPVEVKAARTALNNFFPGYKLSKDEIQIGEAGLSLKESLNNIPGLLINNRNNPSMGDKISIRGIGARASFGIRGIKILMDNIPLTLPDGQSQTNNIDLSSAGTIEVLKGPASSLYGNASGGVINFISEIPSGKIINIFPSVTIGGMGLYKYSLKFSGKVKDHSYLISLNNINSEGFREHSAQKIYQLNTVYRNKINSGLSVQVVLNYFNSPYLQNPGSLNKEMSQTKRTLAREFVKFQGAGETADQLQGGLTIFYLRDIFDVKSTIYYLKRNLINPIPGRIIKLNRDVFGLRSDASLNFNSGIFRYKLSGGIDIENQRDKRMEFTNNGLPHLNFKPAEVFDNLRYGDKLNDQNENITGAGPFLSAEIFINETVGLLGVLRYDFFNYKVTDYLNDNSGERKLQKLSPAAGILFKPVHTLRIFFNYATSFQSPTAAELSNREDSQGGFNQSLEPEFIRQFELGTEYTSDNIPLKFSLSIFLINFQKLLIPYQSSGSDEIFYRNAGKAVNKGFELSAEVKPADKLTGQISYTNMNFRYEDYSLLLNEMNYQMKDNYVPGIPGEIISFAVYYTPVSGIWGKLLIQWNDSFFTNDFNGTPPGSNSPAEIFINNSYLLTDIRMGYKFNFENIKPHIFIGINNLFDYKYNGSVVPNAAGERFFEPSPGRILYAGAAFEL